VQAVLELVKHPNVIFTPHNAFNTREAVIRKSQQSIQQVESFLKTGYFIWPLPGDEII
jgi:D-lactate dehydrogenase